MSRSILNVLRPITGKRRIIIGRGTSSFVPTYDDGTSKTSVKDHAELLDKLQQKFECWKMVRDYKGSKLIDYHFIVRNKNGNYVGACHLRGEHEEGSNVVIGYNSSSDVSIEELHNYNNNYEGLVSYSKL
jgi:hypothetical protein